MNHKAPFLLGGLIVGISAAYAGDAVPVTPSANAQFVTDGSVSDVHDALYLDLALPQERWTVQASAVDERQLTWPDFIREVLSSNLDYAAARYNVDMAVADAAAARLLPNPTLSLGGDRDLTYHDKYGKDASGNPVLLRQVESRSVGIDQTIEWPSKRKWRIRAAEQSLRAAAATLDDFLRNLKLDAAAAFADALAAQGVIEQLRAASAFLDTLNEAQQTRYSAGDIGRPDLLQTQVERQEFLNELARAEDDAEAARDVLVTYLGRNRGLTRFIVSGDLRQQPRNYNLAGMVGESLRKRPDLIALRNSRDAAQSGVEFAKASRIPNLDVAVTYGYNAGVSLNHPVDPTPGFHQLTLNFSLPLPLFDQGESAVRKSLAATDQAQVQLAAAELHAESDIRTAYFQSQSALKRVTSFESGILKDADDLLEARRYGYQRGANTLLDLIDAQRSDNQLHQDYNQAQSELAKAMIHLERVTGFEQGIAF